MKASSLALGVAAATLAAASNGADTFTEALTGGKASGDIRIRYETVDQDNPLDDANAVTVRTRIGYTTGEINGFSAMAEFEDVRVLAGLDDYSVPPTGFQPGEFSVVADPEVTELDQGFLKYKNGGFTSKLGRQVVTYDDHRFVGHVGWRQDRQTFDAARFDLAPAKNITLSYTYLDQRNRIFAEADDIDSKDHLFNGAFKFSAGTLTAFAYLLEVDNAVDNALDTYGVRFAGKTPYGLLYTASFASQTAETAGIEFDADYLMGEIGYNFGPVTLKGGVEILGSDDGAFGFATPLATLHKFNGWADQFLGTPAAGLNDIYVSVGGKVGPGKWAAIYHDFSTDESTDNDDLGSEIDLLYTMKFAKNYNFGVKAAFYSAGDEANGKVDTNKIWAWIGASF